MPPACAHSWRTRHAPCSARTNCGLFINSLVRSSSRQNPCRFIELQCKNLAHHCWQVLALSAEGLALEQRWGELGSQLQASQAQVAQLQGQAGEAAAASALEEQALSEQVSGLQAQVRFSCEVMPLPSTIAGKLHPAAWARSDPACVHGTSC